MVGLIVIPAVLAVLLRDPPFAAGGQLGFGFLLGGAFAIVMVWIGPLVEAALPADVSPPRQWVAGTAYSIGLSAWALAGVTTTFVIFGGAKEPLLAALMGYSLAFVTVALLAHAVGRTTDAGESLGNCWAAQGSQALLVAGLVVGICLSAERFSRPGERLWWSLPLALAATGILAAIVGCRLASLSTRAGYRTRLFVAALIGLIITGIVSLPLTVTLMQSWPAFACVGLGLCGVGLAVWLTFAAPESHEPASALQSAALCGIVVLGLTAACFRLLGGYGLALAVCGSWGILIPAFEGLAPPAEPEHAWRLDRAGKLNPYLCALVLAEVYRLFLGRFRADAFGADVHYGFIAAALGVLATLLAAAYAMRRTGQVRIGRGMVGHALCKTGVVGLSAVAMPLVVALMWGKQAESGLLAGLVVGALVLAAWRSPTPDGGTAPPEGWLFGLGAALAAVPLTHLLEPLLAASRTTKLLPALVALLVALVWVIVDAARARETDVAPDPDAETGADISVAPQAEEVEP
jgi:hypothetical protein